MITLQAEVWSKKLTMPTANELNVGIEEPRVVPMEPISVPSIPPKREAAPIQPQPFTPDKDAPILPKREHEKCPLPLRK